MAFELLQPAAGASVTYPVLVEWVNEPQYSVKHYYMGGGAWIPVTNADYTCDYTCYMWVDPVGTGSIALNLIAWDGGTNLGAVGSRQITVGSYSSDGGGQVPAVDPDAGSEGGSGTNIDGNTSVTVSLDTTELETLLDSYFVIEADTTSLILGQVLIMFAIGFGAAKVVSILSRS